MRFVLIFLCSIPCLFFAETSPTIIGPKMSPSPEETPSFTAPEMLVIQPQDRAKDLLAAYELLKKQPAGKVCITLKGGEKLTDIRKIEILPGHTMLAISLGTKLGSQYKIVPLEAVEQIYNQ